MDSNKIICNLLFLSFLTVRPKISLPKKFYVGREQSVSLTCTVDGNPTPTISWTPCNLPNHVCDKQYLNISKVKAARTTYICNARNSLGSDSATTVLCKWHINNTFMFNGY